MWDLPNSETHTMAPCTCRTQIHSQKLPKKGEQQQKGGRGGGEPPISPHYSFTTVRWGGQGDHNTYKGCGGGNSWEKGSRVDKSAKEWRRIQPDIAWLSCISEMAAEVDDEIQDWWWKSRWVVIVARMGKIRRCNWRRVASSFALPKKQANKWERIGDARIGKSDNHI